jgi:hypothetical protein
VIFQKKEIHTMKRLIIAAAILMVMLIVPVASAKVSHYSFHNGRYRATWERDGGPFGSQFNAYTLRNLSGRRKKVKLALERIPDTHCQWVNNGASVRWTVKGYKFAGEPQNVVECP